MLQERFGRNLRCWTSVGIERDNKNIVLVVRVFDRLQIGHGRILQKHKLGQEGCVVNQLEGVSAGCEGEFRGRLKLARSIPLNKREAASMASFQAISDSCDSDTFSPWKLTDPTSALSVMVHAVNVKVSTLFATPVGRFPFHHDGH